MQFHQEPARPPASGGKPGHYAGVVPNTADSGGLLASLRVPDLSGDDGVLFASTDTA